MAERDAHQPELELRALPGSDRPASTDAGRALPATTRVEATLVLRRRAGAPDPTAVVGSRAAFAQAYGAEPADVDVVRATLTKLGLTILSVDVGARLVRIAGSARDVSRAFGTSLSRGKGGKGRVRSGGLSVPAALDGIVTAVLGLDDRRQATPRTSVVRDAAVATSYTPVDLGRVYDFPAGTDGTGTTVAIIELGGGFAQDDLDTYFSGIGVPSPTVRAVGVDGGANVPGADPDGADGEVLLDIEVVGGLAPGAAILVYFAPNTDAGFLDALATAAHATPTPAAISISWGASEDDWTAQARTAFDDALADAAALGVVVTAAAGDDGSTDRATDGKAHADFPASSPHILACGGTRLDADGVSGTVRSEVVWNNGVGKGATGGGVSDVFDRPTWQAGAGVPTPAGKPGRGVPDVAAVADPQTGYKVRVDGKDLVIGGTSAVAPLWAALAARLSQALGRPLGLLAPALYGATPAGAVAAGFRDITSGTNGAFSAAPGWDACTGLGVPVGSQLRAALTHGAPPPAVGAAELRPVVTQAVLRVVVADLDAALPLYRALGGGAVARASAGGVTSAQVGPFQLLAGPAADLAADARAGTLLVHDMDAAAAAVIAAGGEVLAGPDGGRMTARHPDGAVFDYVADPG